MAKLPKCSYHNTNSHYTSNNQNELKKDKTNNNNSKIKYNFVNTKNYLINKNKLEEIQSNDPRKAIHPEYQKLKMIIAQKTKKVIEEHNQLIEEKKSYCRDYDFKRFNGKLNITSQQLTSIYNYANKLYCGNVLYIFYKIKLQYNHLVAVNLMHYVGILTGNNNIDQEIKNIGEPKQYKTCITHIDKAILSAIGQKYELALIDLGYEKYINFLVLSWKALLLCPFKMNFDGLIIGDNETPSLSNKTKKKIISEVKEDAQEWIKILKKLYCKIYQNDNIDIKKIEEDPIGYHNKILKESFNIKNFEIGTFKGSQKIPCIEELHDGSVVDCNVTNLFFLTLSAHEILTNYISEMRTEFKKNYKVTQRKAKAVERFPGNYNEIIRELRFLYSNGFVNNLCKLLNINNPSQKTINKNISISQKIEIYIIEQKFKIYINQNNKNINIEYLNKTWNLLKICPYINNEYGVINYNPPNNNNNIKSAVDPKKLSKKDINGTTNYMIDVRKFKDEKRTHKKQVWSAEVFQLMPESLSLSINKKPVNRKGKADLSRYVLLGRIINIKKLNKNQIPDNLLKNITDSSGAIEMHNSMMVLAHDIRRDMYLASKEFFKDQKAQNKLKSSLENIQSTEID
jgi:hypothetical protein